MTSAKQRVWVLSEMFYPTEAATGHYMTGIAIGLNSTFEVKAISAGAGAGPFVAHEFHEGVEIFRIRTPRLNKKRFLLRLIQMAWQTLGFVGMAMMKLRRGDAAFVVTNPPSLPIVLVPLLKLKGVQTVLRVDDLYPDAMVGAGLISRESTIYKLVLGLNRFLYRHARLIVTLGRDMQQIVRGRVNPDQADKVVVIPNWGDSLDVAPMERGRNPLLKELGLEDKFVFLVAGNIGRVQGIPALVEAAERLAGNERIRLLFIGDGALKDHLLAEVQKRALTNVIWLPNQPRAKQEVFLNACDAAVLTLAKGMRGIGVPSRMYNYMAAGKPLLGIVDRLSEPGLVIAEERIGWVAAPGEPAEIARVMLSASLEPALAEMGAHSRRLAVERFSKESILNTYSQAFTAGLR
jgi:glycosyltransferase involved in cell wall biosynthesis